MKKVLLLASILMALMVVFAACDDDTSPTVTNPPSTNAPEVTEPAETTSPVPGTDLVETSDAQTTAPDSSTLESATDEPITTEPATSESETDEPIHTHAWGDWKTVQAASCTEGGIREHACTCGATEQEMINARGHTEVVDTGKEATCLSSGISNGKHCSVCGVITVEQIRVPAKGHTEAPVWGKDATCTEPGLTDGKACSVCGIVTVTQNEIPATGHTEVIDRATAATCTEAGKSEGKHCSVCGEITMSPTVTPPLGHKNTTLPSVKATCTKEGLTEGAKCATCGEITVPQTVLPAKGHSEVVDAGKAPTCTKTGLTQGSHCSVCGQTAVAQTIIPATGHTETVVVGKPATCTQNGITDGKKCSTCGEVMIAQTILLSPGHQAVVIPEIKATCAATGLTEGSYCEVCEVILVAQEKILSPYHVFEDGKCADCGCDRFSQGIVYTLNNDKNGYTVSSMGTCADTELIIPATYQDLPVTAIKGSAFMNGGFTSVVVPDSVTSIGAGAFQGCNNLVEVTLPFIGQSINATTSLGLFGYIFGSTGGNYGELTTSQGQGYTYQGYYSGAGYYYIPETLRKVTVTLDTTISHYAFHNCDLIEEIILPDNVVSIGDYAFCNCTALEYVDTTLDVITTIGYSAFNNCTSLVRIDDVEKVIELPTTLQGLGYYAFRNCVNFETLRLNLVGSIGNYAFDGCTGVTVVTFGDQITIIGDHAFQNTQITEVVVPDSVTSIGAGAFQGCNNLVEVTLPFIGQSINATTSLGLFGYIFGSTGGNYGELTTSQGQGYTYQGYYSGAGYYYIPETLRKVTVTLDTTISHYAFHNCDLIEEIILPDNVVSIGDYAFCNCTSLNSLQVSGNATPQSMQRNTPATLSPTGVNAAGTLQHIGDYAFYNCSALTNLFGGETGKLIITKTVTTLGEYSFYGCTGFTELSIDIVGVIDNHVFDNCTNLTKITIGDQVTHINAGAFRNTSITSIIVPDNVTFIGNGAFMGCNSLVEMTLPFIGADNSANEITTFGYIFGYTTSGASSSAKTSSGLGYTAQLYSNSYYAFYIPTTLRRVTITKDLVIQSYAFQNCDMLDVVALPENIVRIGTYALGNMTELSHLYYGGSAANWKSVTLESDWNKGANSYHPIYNAKEFGPYFDLSAVRLQKADRNMFLLPLDESVTIKILNLRTGSYMTLAEAGVKIEEFYNDNNTYSFTSSGKLTGKNGGFGSIEMYYTDKNGKKLYFNDNYISIFVVDQETNGSMPGVRFTESDREYVAMCLDMFYGLYKIEDPTNYVDETDMNMMDMVVFSISDLSGVLESLLKGDSYDETLLKNAFADFIQDYVDSKAAHNVAIQDTKAQKGFLDIIEDLVDNKEDVYDAIGFPKDIMESIDTANDLIKKMKDTGLTIREYERLEELTHKLNDYYMNPEGLRNAKIFYEFMEDHQKKLNDYREAVNRKKWFKWNDYDHNAAFTIFTDDYSNWKVVYDSKPDLIETGFMALDFYTYVKEDYAANIEILLTIRQGLVDEGYDSRDIEIRVIDEMIEEYQNKWLTAIESFVIAYCAETIEGIATKNPVTCIASVAASMIDWTFAVSSKVEIQCLNTFSYAIYRCLDPIDDLYYDGKITSDYATMRTFLDLYLSIMVRSNEIAIKLAKTEPNYDERQDDLDRIQQNIDYIKEFGKLYS